MTSIYHHSLQLLNIACHKLGLKRSEFFLGCFFLCLGMAVRTRNYLAGVSLWNDEAALAGNLLEKPISALFGPLDVGQIAPIGFCLVEKFSILFLSNNELSLRLLPFAAGMVVLPLAFLFALRSVGPFCAVLCMAQLAVIPEAVHHANNLKPYSLDLAIAIGLMLLAWGGGSAVCSRKKLLWLGFWGSIAPWFSFSAVFILFGIGAAVMIRCTLNRHWRGLILFSAVSPCLDMQFLAPIPVIAITNSRFVSLKFLGQIFYAFSAICAGGFGILLGCACSGFQEPIVDTGCEGRCFVFPDGLYPPLEKEPAITGFDPSAFNPESSGFRFSQIPLRRTIAVVWRSQSLYPHCCIPGMDMVPQMAVCVA